MRRIVALAVLILAAAIIFPSVYREGLPRPTIARATPTLSGAGPVDITNGDFSGVGAGEVGTPPTNSGFDTAGGTVGTPPANNGFGSGDFTSWTTTGSPVVNSGGPNGNYAQLASGQKVKSAAFTVASNADGRILWSIQRS